MIIDINFLDSNIKVENSVINVIEVLNKTYFQRIISLFNDIAHINNTEEITFYDKKNEQIDLSGKINVIIDYFNISDKVYNLPIQKELIKSVNDENIKNINKNFALIIKEINNIICDKEIPIVLKKEYPIENIIKFLKFEIFNKTNILENIILLIEIESIIKTSKILIFIDLKKYLNQEEITEIYKYSIYKEVTIILIESTESVNNSKYEKKLKIDLDLTENML